MGKEYLTLRNLGRKIELGGIATETYRAPCSIYINNSLKGEDTAFVCKAEVLDGNGNRLTTFDGGNSVRYSDGSTGERAGQLLRAVLEEMPSEEKEQAKYVLQQSWREKSVRGGKDEVSEQCEILFEIKLTAT